MGLQTWPRRKPPLSSMACLDVEAPTICRVLQLRLQQRRSREQLVDQGIMPPLKTPAAFHEQIRSLERARTGNFLKHKICSRPERSELVRMHILQETQAVASLQATQMKLKRARLTDDLNEKIAQRPGPMELVVKNILPVDTGVKEAAIDSKESNTKTLDVYNFDEDSSDALSPERPASQESQSSACTPPRELRMPEPPSTSPGVNSTVQQSPPTSQSTSDVYNLTKEQQSTCLTTTAQPNATVATTTTPGPVLIKQSQPKTPSDKNRSKKSKEPKPRVKKLKYHQYIPPDQKQELIEMPMDSAYACLLQQQQQFLQLQILSQQQQHFSYQAILPAPLKSGTDSQNSCPQVALNGNGLSTSHVISLPGAAPVRPNCKPDHLPANLEEMKVAELKLELKRRGLPVSGTKTDLIERLKSYQENCNIPPANPNATDMTATTVAPQSENTNSSPPVSPVASKVSGPGIEESGITAGSPSPATSRSSPQRPPREEESPAESRTSEKDKRLHEKELQIEELRRKLEQEQRLVEELRMQLEVEKRNQQGESPPRPSPPPNPIRVKVENESPPNCTGSCSPPGRPMVIKQDPDQSQLAPTHQFMISHQQVNQALAGQPEPQLAVTIQLPDSSIELQPSVSSAIPEVTQSPGSGLQKPEASTAVQKHCTAHTQPMTQTGPLGDSPGSGFPFRADQSQTTGGDAPQHSLNDFLGSGSSSPGRAHSTRAVSKAPTHKCLGPSQPMLIPKFANHGSKSKDPPCYEDAVKQTRSMHIAVQVPSAASQHMDDLFDVLIESGEISPFTKPDLPSLDKLLAVTASVTTLPINTVLSRPPPQIQVAQLPAPARNRPPSLVALAAGGPLATLLGASLAGDEEPRTLRLMEELLEHPNSPMDYTSPSSSSSSSSFHLQSNNLDNMEWLDLTLPAATGELNPLGASSSVCGVFSEDFLDSHELQLNWD